MSEPASPRRRTTSWAMYDWANSAFATTVVAGFFPAFFKDYWSKGMAATESTFWLGVALTVGGLVVALTAPLLGAIADYGGKKKVFLATAMTLGATMTALLFFVEEGSWGAALAFYVLAYVGWLSANVFYDSLIVSVADEKNVDRVSGYGFALGYLGGGLLFAVNVAAFLKPEAFGLSGKVMAVRAAFLSVAIWWVVFSLPLLLRVPEPDAPNERVPLADAVRGGYRQLVATFHEIRRIRPVFLFLLAYWVYIDGVHTLITMAVDYGKSIGFETGDLISALLLVQFVAFPFALLFGWSGQRFGPKVNIQIGLLVYLGIVALAYFMKREPLVIGGLSLSWFHVLAFFVGTVQGGVQALSRSLFTRLVPADKAGEFFGFYNMVGKFAAIIGPTLVGVVSRSTGDARLGILAIAILFLVGAVLLQRVTVPANER